MPERLAEQAGCDRSVAHLAERLQSATRWSHPHCRENRVGLQSDAVANVRHRVGLKSDLQKPLIFAAVDCTPDAAMRHPATPTEFMRQLRRNQTRTGGKNRL